MTLTESSIDLRPGVHNGFDFFNSDLEWKSGTPNDEGTIDTSDYRRRRALAEKAAAERYPDPNL